LNETMQGDDIPQLGKTIRDVGPSASRTVAEHAAVVFAKRTANHALETAILEADVASPETPAALTAAVRAHYPPALFAVVAQVHVLRELSESLLRELDADEALEELIASSTKFEEASEIRMVLEEHGKYAAVPLAHVVEAKLEVLSEADAGILAVLAQVSHETAQAEKEDAENVDAALSTARKKLLQKQAQEARSKAASDMIFQALTDYGPAASRSVRLTAWRHGGSDVSMPPPFSGQTRARPRVQVAPTNIPAKLKKAGWRVRAAMRLASVVARPEAVPLTPSQDDDQQQ